MLLRNAYLGLLALVLLAGCKEWTVVPAPPVALSALEGSAAPSHADFPITPTASRLRLLRAVPPGALATMHLPDIAGAQRRFAGTTLSKFLNSPELEQSLAAAGFDLERLAGFRATPGSPAAGLDMGQFKKALQGELVLSLADLELGAEGEAPTAKALLAVSVAGAENEVQQLLDFVIVAMGNRDGVLIEQGSLEGTSYTRFKIAGPPSLVVEAALFRDAFLLGIGRDIVTEAITRLDDESVEALPDDAAFGRCMQRVGDANDVVRFHVDFAGLHARVRDRIPAEAKPILDFLGFEHMKAGAAALSIDGRDLVTKAFLDSPGGKDLFSDLLRRNTADRSLLERVPTGATSFSLFTFDGQVVLDRLRRTLAEGDRKQLEAELARLQGAGLNLEKDIFSTFGPRFALVSVRVGRRDAVGRDALWNHLMGTAMVVEMRDPTRAAEQLAKLPKGSSMVERTDERIGDAPVTVYRFPREQLPRDLAIVVAPVGGHLMVTLSRETMERMMQKPPAETVAHFRSMVRDVPETAVALSYDDLSQANGLLMAAFAEGVREARAQRGGDEKGPGVPILPSLADQDASPSVSYTLADEHGVFMTTRSPTGGLTETGGLTGLVGAAAIVLPALAAERVQANEAEAMRAMEAIRGALGEYRTALARDADGDGEGEFVFLADLLGDKHARQGVANAQSLLSGFERTPLGYERDGYYFRVYLPAEDGSPIGEHEPLARRRQADGDLAENLVVVVAWPVRAGMTGRRAFLMDGRNRIFACEGEYGGESAPRPDVLNTQTGNLAAKPIEKHQTARDGNRWYEQR